MKLTLKIKLLPNKDQYVLLTDTLLRANQACNYVSNVAFSGKFFNQFRLHKEVYYHIKNNFNLSAQMAVRCIGKVSDSYKINKGKHRYFRNKGSIAYDSRILSYKTDMVSIWSTGGRLRIPFICHNKKYIPFIKGEADLVFNKNKWYLFQSVEIPEMPSMDIEDFIGVDFGQTDIAVLSDGTKYNSEKLKAVRKKYKKVKASVQSKGTKGSRRLLKRLNGREHRFASISNHTISKQIVEKAVREKKGIAIEDLSGIRKKAKCKSKNQKVELNQWSFFQLRQFIAYKSMVNGVKFFVIPPAYTSQTCNTCQHVGVKGFSFRDRKKFNCKNCGNVDDADVNAAKNISAWGVAVNTPEKSKMFCSLHT